MLESIQTVVNIAFFTAVAWFSCKKKTEPNYEDAFYLESRIQYHEDMGKLFRKTLEERSTLYDKK